MYVKVRDLHVGDMIKASWSAKGASLYHTMAGCYISVHSAKPGTDL